MLGHFGICFPAIKSPVFLFHHTFPLFENNHIANLNIQGFENRDDSTLVGG